VEDIDGREPVPAALEVVTHEAAIDHAERLQ
jgi:hypothetical protein